MTLGVSEATLIAVLFEAILFGGFTVFYGIALYTSVPKLGSRLNQIILAVATGMYALAFSHLAIDIQRIINAFIRVSDTKGSDASLSKPSDPLYVAQISVYTVQTILGDAFMIYRLYIVWAKNKLITAPAVVCFLGSIAVGIGGPHSVSQALPGDLIYVAKVKRWGTAFYAITLVTNFICTVLIALRIWWIGHRSSMSFTSRNLSPVLAIIIESGAVYSATLITLIVTYTINDWSHYFFLDAICPVVGLVFTAIIVRIGLGVSTEAPSDSRNLSSHSSAGQPIAVQMMQTRMVRNDTGELIHLPREGSFNDGMIGQDVKPSRDHVAA
ncbi:hypothetical protein ACEPAG_3857 [Sanghuangporus baumii]